MSYLEAHNAMIRGVMVGCTGDFKLNVLADSADVVDWVNILNGAVTVQYSTHYFNRSLAYNTDVLTLTVNVPDAWAFMEVLFCAQVSHSHLYGYKESYLSAFVDSTEVLSRSGTRIYEQGFCLRDIVKCARGDHKLRIHYNPYGGGHTLPSPHGFIVCRYIRETGSLNA